MGAEDSLHRNLLSPPSPVVSMCPPFSFFLRPPLCLYARQHTRLRTFTTKAGSKQQCPAALTHPDLRTHVQLSISKPPQH